MCDRATLSAPNSRPSYRSCQRRTPTGLEDFARFGHLSAWRKGQISKLAWPDVDRASRVLVAPGKTVKNRAAHKLVLEGELFEIIERRWAAQEYKTKGGATAI